MDTVVYFITPRFKKILFHDAINWPIIRQAEHKTFSCIREKSVSIITQNSLNLK